MDDRQSVLGFTEAQLGFFLVLLFVVVWAAVGPSDKPPTRDHLTADSAGKLISLIGDLQRKADSLQQKADSLESPIWPSCASKRIAPGVLLTVIAIGDGLFRVGDDTLDFGELAAHTEEDRAEAYGLRCRHEVRFGYRHDLLSPVTESARQKIGSLSLRIIPGPIVSQ
jgi:hypothetical protein